MAEVGTFWATGTATADLAGAETTDELYEHLMGEATRHYEAREAELGVESFREVERQVMLRIIDQKWREHLYDMDYLQGGIGLRAMGQKDPLVEWQREGYEMFSQMMHAIAQDFVKYVMHVEVVTNRPNGDQPPVQDVSYSAPEDPVQGAKSLVSAGQAAAGAEAEHRAAPPDVDDEPTNTPIVKADWEKTGRNEPCPCGSGRKYKLCHGR